MATLKDYFNNLNQTRTLPNQGGSYSINMGGEPLPSYFTPTPASKSSVFHGPQPKPPTPPAPTAEDKPKVNAPQGYFNPATGQLYTAKEIVANMAKKIPLTNASGDIGKYEGDAMASPEQSAESLRNTARDLSMARNDIAVGETDPYKVGKDSGIAFSPAQLNAIEKAYAGIYDPAIKDVFSRIKAKEELDTEMAKAKTEEAKLKVQKEMEIFRTNESIRQWKATTGTTKTGGASDFSRSQLNSGASKAGMGISLFEDLDPDIQNFYINTPKEMDPETEKLYPMDETFKNLIRLVEAGEKDRDEAAEEIMTSNLPDVVKHHFISKLPLENAVKEGYFARIWKAITGN